MEDKQSLQQIIKQVIPNTEVANFGELIRTPIQFFCRCGIGSIKTKIALLGAEEIHNMQKDGHNEIKCIYCSRVHHLKESDFDDMIELCSKKNVTNEHHTTNTETSK